MQPDYLSTLAEFSRRRRASAPCGAMHPDDADAPDIEALDFSITVPDDFTPANNAQPMPARSATPTPMPARKPVSAINRAPMMPRRTQTPTRPATPQMPPASPIRRAPVQQPGALYSTVNDAVDWRRSSLPGVAPIQPPAQPAQPARVNMTQAKRQLDTFVQRQAATPEPSPDEFQRQLEQRRQAREAEAARKQNELKTQGQQYGTGRRLLGKLAQPSAEIAAGIAGLPAAMLRTNTSVDPAVIDHALGSYGRMTDAATETLQNERTRLGSLPADAGFVEKAANVGADVVGELAPIVAGGMVAGAPAAVAAGGRFAQSLGQGKAPTAAATDAAFAGAGVVAGGQGDKLARIVAPQVAKTALGQQIAGRAISGAAGAGAGLVEGGLRGQGLGDTMRNAAFSGGLSGVFYGGGKPSSTGKSSGIGGRAELSEPGQMPRLPLKAEPTPNATAEPIPTPMSDAPSKPLSGSLADAPTTELSTPLPRMTPANTLGADSAPLSGALADANPMPSRRLFDTQPLPPMRASLASDARLSSSLREPSGNLSPSVSAMSEQLDDSISITPPAQAGSGRMSSSRPEPVSPYEVELPDDEVISASVTAPGATGNGVQSAPNKPQGTKPIEFNHNDYYTKIDARRRFQEMEEEDQDAVYALFDEMRAASKVGDKKAFKDAKQKVENLTRDDWQTVVGTVRKAGLLTSLRTHARNVGGNAIFQGLDEAARVPGFIADLALSAATKQRSLSGVRPDAVWAGVKDAGTKGIREAWQTMKQGAPELQQAQQQMHELASGNRFVDAYVNTVFRSLSAEDRLFRTYAMTRALHDRANVQALNEAKAGTIKRADIAVRRAELMADPPNELTAAAIADAEVATFNNDNPISTAISKGRTALRESGGFGKTVNLGIDLFMPFDKTPGNIIARALEFSPLGYGKNAVQAAKAIGRAIGGKAFTPDEQRAFSQTFGRATVGSGLILLGYTLAEKGYATGMWDDETPQDFKKLAIEKQKGRSPMSVLNPETNTWHQVGGFSPTGNLIALGATIFERGSDAGAAAIGVGKVLWSQPLLEGVDNLKDFGKDPARAAGNLAGSFVPRIVADVGALADNRYRKSEGLLKSTGLDEAVAPYVDVQAADKFASGFARSVPALRTYLNENPNYETRLTDFIDPTLTRTNRAPIAPAKQPKRRTQPKLRKRK